MEQTTGELTVQETLTITAEEKPISPSGPGSFFSTYSIPLFSLMLFTAIALRALYPESFHFGFKRQKAYQFTNESLGFFIGDTGFFVNNSQKEAEDNIVALFPPKLQKQVEKVIRPVLILCEKHQLDPFWVLSVMWTESHFKHEVTSSKGARGLMQIMPPTYVEIIAEIKQKGFSLEAERSQEQLRYTYEGTYYALGHKTLVSKLRNLEAGIYYLKGLLEAFNNNHYYATVAYNMGPYWTRSQLKNNLPVGKKNQYLEKVLKNYYLITKRLSQNTNVTFIPRI